MSNVDAAWFRMDRPENAADVVVLLVFRQLPDFARLRLLVKEKFLACARFRQRAVPGGLGADAWEDDPEFDFDAHLVKHTLKVGGQRALERLAGEIATEPLDPAHPLWSLHYIRQPRGGAVIMKFSHCMGDGFALVGLFLSLDDAAPHPSPRESRHVLPAARQLAPWLDPGATARQALADRALAVDLGKQSARIAAAVARFAALPFDRSTVLSRKLSGKRRTAWSKTYDSARIREGARANGATMNEVLLSAAAGALRSYLASADEPVDTFDLRALVPVNLRPGPPDVSDGKLGNRFGLVFLDLPIHEARPAQRLEAIRASIAVLKGRPDPVAAWMLLAAMGAVPGITPWAAHFFTRKASVVITNVPGPREICTYAGREVGEAMFWVPHPGALGVGISILSYAGSIKMGVRADTGVMPDPSSLVARFHAELVTLGAVAPARPGRRTPPAVPGRAASRTARRG